MSNSFSIKNECLVALKAFHYTAHMPYAEVISIYSHLLSKHNFVGTYLPTPRWNFKSELKSLQTKFIFPSLYKHSKLIPTNCDKV